MPELPLVVTVEDAKSPILLVRILRTIAEQISTLGNRLDNLARSIRMPSVAAIRNSLQSDGAFPLNLTNLRGIVADPQPASALRYDVAPTGLVLQSLRDTQFVLVKNGTGYDLCTVIGGNPNSLFTLIAGASGGSSMTTNTAQTVTGAKTFNAGTLKLAGSGGTSQVLKQLTVGGAITVAQLALADLSDYTEWTAYTPTLTASSGTFSGTITTAKYRIVGKKMTIAIVLSSCTVSATPNTLLVSIAAGKTAVGSNGTGMPYVDNSVAGSGYAGVNSGTTILLFKDLGAPNWSTAGGTSFFRFTLEFEIA